MAVSIQFLNRYSYSLLQVVECSRLIEKKFSYFYGIMLRFQSSRWVCAGGFLNCISSSKLNTGSHTDLDLARKVSLPRKKSPRRRKKRRPSLAFPLDISLLLNISFIQCSNYWKGQG